LEEIREITRDKIFNLYLKMGQFRKWKPNTSRMAFEALFRGIIILLFLCVAVNFMNATELINQHELHMVAKESIGNIAVKAMKSIVIEPLEHEKMFTETLKDCMPSIEEDGNNNKNKKECMTFIPEGSKERIAVLTPPGKMNESLLKFIRIMLMKGKKDNDGEFAAAQVEVIPTTNMVPYVYGKTHGYTRIIRIVPQPLLLGATDTLRAALQSSSSLSMNDITLNDLKAALRQQIRYHCRLNHVAAHTAMWTIGVEDFAEVERLWLVETARGFFGLDSDQEDLFVEVNAEYESAGADDDDESNHGVVEGEDDDDSLTKLSQINAEGSRVMGLLQMKVKNATNGIFKILDDVLLDEMRLSKNLTAWPCESFWTVGEPGKRLEISSIISSISKAMSPNCTAPYTSCFVKKDKCEGRGDGKCK